MALPALLRVQQPVQSCADQHPLLPEGPLTPIPTPQLILLANDWWWDRSCREEPQLSGRRSHRWARLSQLNPQAAGSDDAQDASYQQGGL